MCVLGGSLANISSGELLANKLHIYSNCTWPNEAINISANITVNIHTASKYMMVSKCVVSCVSFVFTKDILYAADNVQITPRLYHSNCLA